MNYAEAFKGGAFRLSVINLDVNIWRKAQKVFVELASQNLASANPGKHVFFSALAFCRNKSIAIRSKIIRPTHRNRECVTLGTSVKSAAIFLALTNRRHLFFHCFLTFIINSFLNNH